MRASPAGPAETTKDQRARNRCAEASPGIAVLRRDPRVWNRERFSGAADWHQCGHHRLGQQKQLRISGLETDVLKRPPGSPYYDAIHEFGTGSGSVVLRIRTDRKSVV